MKKGGNFILELNICWKENQEVIFEKDYLLFFFFRNRKMGKEHPQKKQWKWVAWP
jgi:hypothetical protein